MSAATPRAGVRPVQAVVPSETALEGAGFQVRRPFPTARLDHVDPFLLLDHVGPARLPPGGGPGAPDHPHRGFETVTYVLEGALKHEDSTGGGGTLRAGDVQWMTAGGGIVHSEGPDPAFYGTGGPVHGLQLWVNLPARAKAVPPRYQHIPAATVPVRTDGATTLRVIAGHCDGLTGPVATHTPVTYAHLSLEPGAAWHGTGLDGRTALVYVIAGAGACGPAHTAVADGALAILGPGDSIAIRAASSLEALVLVAEPLDEPVVRHGPFVMNTVDEIHRAIDDYRRGRLGAITR